MSASAVAASSRAASVEYTAVTAPAVDACANVLFSAFDTLNRSLGLPPEFPSVDLPRAILSHACADPSTYLQMAVRPNANSDAEHYVAGVGEVLGVVYMSCADEVWGIGPIATSTAAQGQGIGRGLMQRCLKEAESKQVRSVRLIGAVSNVGSFGLYHSLGFRVCEYMVDVQGDIAPSQRKQLDADMHADGISIRPMTRDDIAACSQLYIAANSFSRLAGITGSFEQQGAGGGPAVSCYVAVDNSDKVVGYTTGASVLDHQSAINQPRQHSSHRCPFARLVHAEPLMKLCLLAVLCAAPVWP